MHMSLHLSLGCACRFGLVVNNATTHAKQKIWHLSFYYYFQSVLVIWGGRVGILAASVFSCVYTSIFVLITHTKFLNEINIAVLYWSQDCVHLLLQIVLLVLSTWLIIDILDNVPAESQRNDRKQRKKSASRLDVSHQGNLRKKKKVYFVPHNNQYALKVLSCHQVPTTSQKKHS